MSDPMLTQVVVDDIANESTTVIVLSLKRSDGGPMPAFAAGSHIELLIPNGSRRSYSLCSDPYDLSRYEIAVRRSADSRGASAYLHNMADVGDLMLMSAPKCGFALADDASRHILIAGGIGITPFIAMLHELQRTAAHYRLHYLAKSAHEACFSERIASLAGPRARFYFSSSGPQFEMSEISEAVADPAAQIYCCGPNRLMDAVRDATLGAVRPARFEAFVEAPVKGIFAGRPFEVELQSTGQVIEVDETHTMLEALRENGLDIPSSCEHGICGTCLLKYVDGTPIHRDGVLKDEARLAYVAPCISRAEGRLTLAL